MGIFAAIVVLFLRIIPFQISYLISHSRKKNIIIILVANILVVLGIRWILLGNINIYNTLRDILFTNYTYQRMWYIPISALLCFIFAIIIGNILKITFKANYHKNNIKLLTLISSAYLMVVVIILCISLNGATSVKISEIQAYNSVVFNSKEYDSYIEVYNPGFFPCNLDEMYISDSEKVLKKIRIQNGNLAGKEYSVIPIHNDEISLSKKEGQTIILSNENGLVLDEKKTEKTAFGQASGWTDEGKWAVVIASPYESNAEYTSNIDTSIEKPSFSVASGFFDKSFYLSIEVPEGCKVHYTLDGSIPDVDDTCYDNPVYVNESKEKAFIIRAAAFDDKGKQSEDVSATYWINSDYAGQPVISIMADPEDLYGEYGIYTGGTEYDEWLLGAQEGERPTPNFAQNGRGWEKPAHFDYVSDDQSFSQNVGLRIQGGSSRYSDIKALGLFARTDYDGNEYFIEDFFGVKASKIRTKGGYANTIVQRLASDRSVSTQKMKRVNVFVNGIFLCNTNIIEKYDDTYFENYYGIDKNNIMIFDGFSLVENNDIVEKEFRSFLDYIRTTDFSNDYEYNNALKKMDIQSYLDSLCIRTYVNDMDFTDDKNMVIWRSVLPQGDQYGDCRWHWALNDLDGMEWSNSKVSDNSYTKESDYNGGMKIGTQYIYTALKENTSFREAYVNTFMDLVNSIFSVKNVKKVMEEYGEINADYQSGNGGTREMEFYTDFFENRADYIVPYMARELEITGTLEEVTISINDADAGMVKVNTVEINDYLDDEKKFTGKYFTDYTIKLEAIPAEGYRFVGWSGELESSNSVEAVELKVGGTKINAFFEKE